jgi:hypothetical protein
MQNILQKQLVLKALLCLCLSGSIAVMPTQSVMSATLGKMANPVTGTVTTSKGEPLAGVNVYDKTSKKELLPMPKVNLLFKLQKAQY